MRQLVRREMEAGALGIGSALVYAPGIYATTEELIALCKVAAEYQGKYISHLRYEGAAGRRRAGAHPHQARGGCGG
jgi:N-acyl-D-amino-acid deacylase